MLYACGITFVNGVPVISYCRGDSLQQSPNNKLLESQQVALTLQRQIADMERRLVLAGRCKVAQNPAPPQPPPQEAAPEPPPPPKVAKNCPPPPSDEVLLLLDASRSMGWNYNVDPRIEAEADRAWERAVQADQRAKNMVARNPFSAISPQYLQLQRQAQQLSRHVDNIYKRLDTMPGTDRIEVAKKSLIDVVKSSGPQIRFAFMSFNRCKTPRWHGRYGNAQRGQLISAIGRVSLDQNTALADSINQIPARVRAAGDKPVNVVLVSDGRDSCEGDPCAAARRLKQRHPNVYISVIEIAKDARHAQCVAKATGGEYLTPANAGELPNLLKRATGQLRPEGCQ